MAKGNRKGFLSNELQTKVCRHKAKYAEKTLELIAKKFKVTERQVFNAIHKYPDISGVRKRDFTDEALLKRIAIWKSNNPKATLESLEKKFKVPTHVARYALQKFAGEADLGKATKKGRMMQSKVIANDIDQVDVLKKQLNFCLAELENNNALALASRIDLLYKAMRIRVHLQSVELESHLKRADSDLIANIVRRFMPEATDDEIIKIYNEELAKLKEQYGTL